MKLSELRAKRSQILDLASRHGVSNVRVFGSVARNEAQADSDIDFLVDVTDLSRFEWGGGGLLMDLQELLGCEIDLLTEQDLYSTIRERVLQEAVPL